MNSKAEHKHQAETYLAGAKRGYDRIEELIRQGKNPSQAELMLIQLNIGIAQVHATLSIKDEKDYTHYENSYG